MSYSPYSVDRMQGLSRDVKVGYGCASSLISIGTTETDWILLRNPLGSGKLVELFELFLSLPDASNAIRSVIRFYTNSTITSNGTAVTTAGFRSGQPAASLLINSLPTISARGDLIQAYGITYDPLDRFTNLTKFIEENKLVLITAQASSPSTNHTFSLAWAETIP